MGGRVALIDADIVCYRAAAGVQVTEYLCAAPDGRVGPIRYKKDIPADYTIVEKNVEIGDVSHALYNVKRAVEAICKAVDTDTYVCFLSAPTESNFRFKLAKQKEYKGNRKDLERPEHLGACREYITRYMPHKVAKHCEADDMMGIAQCAAEPETTVICSIDKDLLMIPGHHYNWVTDTHLFVQGLGYLTYDKSKVKGCGERFYFAQMLLGDATDNIPGAGTKPREVEQVLNKLQTAEEMQAYVDEQYQVKWGADWQKYRDEVHGLVWIARCVEDVKKWL